MKTDRVLRSSRRPDAQPTPTPAVKKRPGRKHHLVVDGETPARFTGKNVAKTPDLPDISTLVITTGSRRRGRPRKTPQPEENLKIVKKRGRPRKTPDPSKIQIDAGA